MSAGGFQTTPISTPTTSTTPTSTSSAGDPFPPASTNSNEIDGTLLIKNENNSESPVSQAFVMLPPQNQSQSSGLQQNIGSPSEYTSSSFNFPYSNSRQTNLFLFTSDGNFASLSPHQSLDVKDIEKSDPSGVILSSRPLSNSSNASPKPFMSLHITESKNDKMISGFDGRVDGLSPLSVIAVSAYQDAGHPSPNLSGSLLSRSQPILRYQPGGDAMLSALNYNESDMLQEGGFDVPSSTAFGTLDGLLGTGIGASGTPSMRLPDLLDGEMSQESYMEAAQDLQLSPQTFSAGNDAFTVSESTSLTGVSESPSVENTEETAKVTETSGALLMDKLRTKGRPVKATSPSRPGTQPCPTCGKVFSNSSALTKHKLTHSDERKYVCQLCAKAFKRQDHLNGHMLTHRNKKPFECDAEGCGKSYCDARSLRRHKENHHSNSSSSATPISVSALGSHVTVIPGLTHLGFNSLQPSFPASVITSSTSTVLTESSLGNRIQYAPPPPSSSSHGTTISSESVARSVGSPLTGSVIPTAASHLQFLAFHQQPSAKAQVQHSSSNTPRTDSSTLLTSWKPQTINTSALFLAQNFGSSQSNMCQSQPAQLVTGSFTMSAEEQTKTSQSSKQGDQPNAKSDTEKSPSFLSQDTSECTSSRPSSAKFGEVLIEKPPNSSAVAEQPANSQLQTTASEALNILRPTASTAESLYPRQSTINLSLIKIEINEASGENGNISSVPTTPTTKEPAEYTPIGSPLLQQLLNPQQSMEVKEEVQLSEQSYIVSSQEQQPSAVVTQQSRVLIPQWTQVPYAVPNSTTSNHRFSQDPKPVECSLCQRKFKNIPALNGHMRLHGGYFKKENDVKKGERKPNGSSSHTPLQTVSTSVRALIEEKIIQKRNTAPLTVSQASSVTESSSQCVTQNSNFQNQELNIQGGSSPIIAQASPILSPVAQETSVFSDLSMTSQPSVNQNIVSGQNFNSTSYNWLEKIDLKEQFRVPQPPVEKHRRHSDSDHFIPPKRPCTTFTSSALADLLRRKVVAKRTSRTGSDPGELFNFDNCFPLNSNNTIPMAFLQKVSSPFQTSDTNPLDSSADLMQQDDLGLVSTDGSALPILSAEDIPEAQPPMLESMRDGSDMSAIESHCLDKNVFFDSSNNDISVGQSFPEISVSELEMMQLTSVATVVAPTLSNSEVVEDAKPRTGEDSNDDDVFLSPTSLPTSPMKISKKKHRPEPLYIPPYVNTCGFTSRLRSPRLWDPSNPDHKKQSPPPYTPPPMLSPVRSGSGLFWHIISGSGSLTPKSAPMTPSFGLARKGSTGETTPEEEEDLGEVPESDIRPHVNIGSYYQAKLPAFIPNFKGSVFLEDKDYKVWDPSTMDQLCDDEVEAFQDLACSAVVPGGGKNKEYALHLLHICKGKIQDAILSLMNTCPKLPSNHPLLSYEYSECDKWSPEEIEAYHQGLLKCDKDFFSIAKEIPSKTVKQCIQFYYLWKKVCPDEYKRIRAIRKRKENESLFYNLRSKETDEKDKNAQTQSSSPSGDSNQVSSSHGLSEKNVVLNGQMKVEKSAVVSQNSFQPVTSNSMSSTYNGSNALSSASAYDFPLEPLEEFPCKICGKVFNKVKSRSAHMKSHRPLDSEKNKKYEC